LFMVIIAILVGCQRFEPDRILKIVTDSVTDISSNSCSVRGTIIDAGSSYISQHGFCWSLTPDPDIADSANSLGPVSKAGLFTSILTGLLPDTNYYVRAYAKKTDFYEYGSVKRFKTLDGIVVLYTEEVTEITTTTAICGGIITHTGGNSINQRGVCWNTTGNPTLENNEGFTNDGVGAGFFSSTMKGLTEGITYFVKAYAINNIDTSYGEQKVFIAFECATSTLTDYDGNTYLTVRIGNQCWMKENLKVSHYSDGTAIPLLEADSDWDTLSLLDKAYCFYENSNLNEDIYGALYTWETAMNGSESSNIVPSGVQGICPTGWHLPSENEWKELELHLGMSQSEADKIGWRGTDEGGMLKETDTIHWENPNEGATNSSGFSALPGGGRSYGGMFFDLGTTATFWTSTESGKSAWRRRLSYDYSKFYRSTIPKNNGFSVRCLRDD